jgi:hypothetical protein
MKKIITKIIDRIIIPKYPNIIKFYVYALKDVNGEITYYINYKFNIEKDDINVWNEIESTIGEDTKSLMRMIGIKPKYEYWDNNFRTLVVCGSM